MLCELGLVIFLHVMHVCREVNLASSSSWMYIAYIFYWLIWVHPFVDFFWQKGGEHCFVFTLTPLLMIDKKGEKDFECIYAYLCFCIYWVYASYNKQTDIWEKYFWEFKQKGGEGFWKICLIYACFSLLVDAYICLVSCAFHWISYFLLWCMS